MATVPSAALFQSLPRGTIREGVVGRILAAVVQGEFPAGHRMIVQRMAEQLGVSATPVREALFELASIGIVHLLPNRGAVLREFGPRQLHEIYQVRRVLEVEAVRGACGQIDIEKLHSIEQELRELAKSPREPGWSQRAMDVDVRLHALIADACGSARLQHELERYNILMQVIREVVRNAHRAQDVAIGAHLEIIRELLAGDVESAAEVMARHIDTTAVLVGEAMYPDTVAVKKDAAFSQAGRTEHTARVPA